MMKNWIIGALMSVVLLGAIEVMAQDAKAQKGKVFIDRTYLTLTCECGTSGIKGERVEVSLEEIKRKGYSVKWDYQCPTEGCRQRWYTTDKNFYIPKKYVNVGDSKRNANPRHICSHRNGCLAELPHQTIRGELIRRTLVRQCESTDTLIVYVQLGPEEKWTLQMVGKTLDFETSYKGKIKCSYFAPAQHRSAQKQTAQGANGKPKPGLRLKR